MTSVIWPVFKRRTFSIDHVSSKRSEFAHRGDALISILPDNNGADICITDHGKPSTAPPPLLNGANANNTGRSSSRPDGHDHFWDSVEGETSPSTSTHASTSSASPSASPSSAATQDSGTGQVQNIPSSPGSDGVHGSVNPPLVQQTPSSSTGFSFTPTNSPINSVPITIHVSPTPTYKDSSYSQSYSTLHNDSTIDNEVFSPSDGMASTTITFPLSNGRITTSLITPTSANVIATTIPLAAETSVYLNASKQSHNNRAVVAGASVGAVVLLLIFILLLFFICQHKRRRHTVASSYTSIGITDAIPDNALRAPIRKPVPSMLVRRKPVPEMLVRRKPVPEMLVPSGRLSTLSMMTASPSVDPFQAFRPDHSLSAYSGPPTPLRTSVALTDPFADPLKVSTLSDNINTPSSVSQVGFAV